MIYGINFFILQKYFKILPGGMKISAPPARGPPPRAAFDAAAAQPPALYRNGRPAADIRRPGQEYLECCRSYSA
ncbi:hypothetical protein A6M21_14455 [Desulfotomaculum copahuensis]|uniref:Uncharacterized protein n=1 Tax=Desulfotomaculum copahuensis TaxID=1838280 RepID=A0A1B7LBN5_9FIRM|nr:hypothetical protein A6M21_14455 [Desulfotomaculum copahuensis]